MPAPIDGGSWLEPTDATPASRHGDGLMEGRARRDADHVVLQMSHVVTDRSDAVCHEARVSKHDVGA